MAFVHPTSASALRLSTFTNSAVDTKRPTPNVAPRVRMAADQQTEEPKVVGTAGNSLWKENLLVGGFPGGEGFFKKWIADGMTDDVPDMPSFMQPSADFTPKKEKKGTGVLAVLDRTEFFKDFVGQEPEAVAEDQEDTADPAQTKVSAPTVVVQEEDLAPNEILSTEVPDESLYAPYFPKSHRNIAPNFIFDYNRASKDRSYDKVGINMIPISPSYTDVCYPKEMKNKAPFIEISYTGSLASASLKLSMDEVEPLPTLPPPPKAGQAVVSLTPGVGGGLKLDFEDAQGEKLI